MNRRITWHTWST